MKNFIKLNSIIIFVFLIFVNESYGQFRKTATAGFVFLELAYTARSTALAEATIAMPDLNSDGIFINPSILGFTKHSQNLSVSYSPYFADIKQYSSTFSYSTDFGVFGVGLQFIDFGQMLKTKRAPGQGIYDVIGEFNAKGLAFGLSYAKALTDRFSFGVTAKYVREEIDMYSAKNFLFDGGVLYWTGFGSLRIAASIQNFGTDAKYINDNFKMPTVMKLGLAGELFGNDDTDYKLTAMLEAQHPGDGDEKLNSALEFSWNKTVFLRGGYKFFYDEETYTFGAGITTEKLLNIPVNFDFAIANYGRLGNIYRLTLQLGLL